MKKEFYKIIMVLLTYFVVSCGQNDVKKAEDNTEEVKKVTIAGNFDGSGNVIAYQQDGKMLFYDVETQKTYSFDAESEPVFNMVYAEYEKALYYTVVRKGTLWLKKAEFMADKVQIEEIVHLNIKKEDCFLEMYETYTPLRYNNGKLMIKSNFSWDIFGFADYIIYNLNTKNLVVTQDLDEVLILFGEHPYPESPEDFENRNGTLYYTANGKNINLIKDIDFKDALVEIRPSDVHYIGIEESPDGTKLTFVPLIAFGDIPEGIRCIADSDGKNQQKISYDGANEDLKPQWLGNRLVFTMGIYPEQEQAIQRIYITHANDNKPELAVYNIEAFTTMSNAKQTVPKVKLNDFFGKWCDNSEREETGEYFSLDFVEMDGILSSIEHNTGGPFTTVFTARVVGDHLELYFNYEMGSISYNETAGDKEMKGEKMYKCKIISKNKMEVKDVIDNKIYILRKLGKNQFC